MGSRGSVALAPVAARITVAGFFAALAVAGPLESQLLPSCDDARIRQMHYSNSSGEAGRTIFFYGRDHVLRSALWLLEDRSRHSCNFHLHDDAGREVEKVRQFSDGLTSIERYEYDGAGRRTFESFERSDGVRGTASFSWNEHGRLAAADLENFRGWLSARVDYRSDSSGLSGATISRDGEPIGDISYIHDGAGRLVEETWRLGDWSQTFRYEYEPVPETVYSATNPLFMMNTRFAVRSESYDFNDETGGPSHYTYDEGGQLTKKVFERSDGVRTVTTYDVDDAGSLTGSSRVYADGRTAHFSYTYDPALRMTAKRFTRSDGAEGSETYSYDRLGRLESAVFRNVDFWLNGIVTFEHDGWGHLSGGRFAGEDGFDADIEIRTDDHGNVIRIHWSFSFGKTQTYTLDYRPVEGTPGD